MADPTGLCYLDIETTGLSELAQPFEIGWCPDRPDATTRTMLLPHTLAHAEPAALEVNRYWQRGIDTLAPREMPSLSQLQQELTGVCVVAANPRFDARFLTKILGYEPYHYRWFDIETQAATVFGEPFPIGMRGIRERLVAAGYHIPENDHTAKGDIICLRASHKALCEIAERRRRCAP